MFKIVKLQGLENYATWRGDARMLLRASDTELLGPAQELLSKNTGC